MTHFIANPEEMTRLAASLAERLRPGEVIALNGTLGAGKTYFVKGLAAALGYAGEVTSPTFTLVQEYLGGRMPVFHMDFYRLETADEALDAGLDEYFPSDGLSVIEWAGRFPEILPPDRWQIEIQVREGTNREVSIEQPGH